MTAVVKVVKQEQCPRISGIIYDNPEKFYKQKELTIDQRIANLNEKGQRLYSILNTSVEVKFTDAWREKRYCKNVRNNFSRLIKNVLVINQISVKKSSCNSLAMPQKINNQMKIINNLVGMNGNSEYFIEHDHIDIARCKELIKLLIMVTIRKSFCKEIIRETKNGSIRIFLPEVVEKIIFTMCGIESEISVDEKEAFLITLNMDYTRAEQLENVKKSIINQNVKVQAKEVDGIVKLQLSNAEHKRKKYIFQFIKEFASCDRKEQNKMFLYIKKLIVLFYCGIDKYEHLEEKEVSGWEFSLDIEENAYYSENIKKLMEKKKECKNKVERRNINEEIRKEIKSKIHESYNQGNAYFKNKYIDIQEKKEDSYEKATYWLSYITERAEQLLVEKKTLLLGKEDILSIKYLCEYTWKEWLSFICMKYVDMGKAVYHFAMPDLTDVPSTEHTVIGAVLPQFREGLTSFDYERIQAYENFDREISMYVIFAVHNFATAVLREKEQEGKKQHISNEDVLYLPKDAEKEYLREDSPKRILQFFGGESRWKQQGEDKKFVVEGMEDGYSLFQAVKEELKAVRNSSFHYTAMIGDAQSENGIIRAMFEREYAKAGQVICKKYYSNNVLMFYKVADINRLIQALYRSPKERPAQIPSYERILKRSEFAVFVDRYIESPNRQNLNRMDTTEMETFRSALYFVLKQIYYYDFLQNSNLKRKFLENMRVYIAQARDAFQQDRKNRDLADRKNAAGSFERRINEITKEKTVTFGGICQQIMTDYNMQNDREMKVEIGRKSSDKQEEKENKKMYGHFPLILYECIRNTFYQYLNITETQDRYDFLKRPEDRREFFSHLKEEEFCQGQQISMYQELLKDSEDRKLAWYTLAHFLNQRQLNHMMGTFKSHMQFVEDIDKREAIACQYQDTAKKELTKKRVEAYKRIVNILEFSMLFCEQMTNVVTDYFKDEEEYAKHLARYVNFEDKALKGSVALKQFCEREVKEGGANGKIGLYYDALNPIVDKNIVKAMMYGNEKLLEACVEPITEAEIQEYYKNKNQLSGVFKAGRCEKKWQQIKLKDFQNQKNRIELTNVAIYMEIIDDLMSQLISWAYLRERDLMYYQLGYYYTKLFHGDNVLPEDPRRTLKGKEFSIVDGAILYQIVAMNTYIFPVFVPDKKKKDLVTPSKEKGGIGKGLRDYVKMYSRDIYYEGRQLFERRDSEKALDIEHDEIATFRNYIDHFKYFSNLDRSMIDLYSIIFDNFFSYSSKLHRSVPIVLQNILARYFVIASINIGTKEMLSFNSENRKQRAFLTFKDKQLYSGTFTYKIKEKKEIKKENKTFTKELEKKIHVDARGEKFLEELKRILEYSK